MHSQIFLLPIDVVYLTILGTTVNIQLAHVWSRSFPSFAILEQVPIQFSKPDFAHSLVIAHRAKIYAYDAYVLDCAIRHKAPILTLDVKLMRMAKTLNTHILEI